jgi:malic enzyme
MAVKFDVIEDKDGNIKFLTIAEGNDIIHTPILNRGTAFTEEEREHFGLDGLIPPHILTIDEQLEKIHRRFSEIGKPLEICKSCGEINKETYTALKLDIDMARYNFLRDLQDRNEILFYAFAYKFMEEVIPIVYTPTVGEAVLRYSRDSSRFRGIFLSPLNIKNVVSILDHFRFERPTIAVVTDNQGILGLGDQGVGGIDIPIGKLALYVLGAGIRPWETLPLTLDVGTDNPRDLKDRLYLGYKTGRLKGAEYFEFMDKFIDGIKSKFPNILVQWEDFSRQNAFTVLDKYRDKVLSFNDDIQGTGAMALAGILNALKLSGGDLTEQRFVIYGAGAGGIGIARQIVAALEYKHKISNGEACNQIVTMDSGGLVTEQRELADYKKTFAKSKKVYENWKVEDITKISLLEVINNFRPTVLIGTSGVTGRFDNDILSSMTENTERPIIFPLSNPTSKMEARPREIYKVTEGKAIVATGSPIEPFEFEGGTVVIGQGNNMFIFPGVGFGAILSGEDYINDEVFTEAAYTLSDQTPEKYIKRGTVYPSIADIRFISAQIALATVRKMGKERKIKELTLDEIQERMWKPMYHPLMKK